MTRVRLTRRERQVLDLLLSGCTTDRELAQRLVVNIRTIESHMQSIRDKTGKRRSGLPAWAQQNEYRSNRQ